MNLFKLLLVFIFSLSNLFYKMSIYTKAACPPKRFFPEAGVFFQLFSMAVAHFCRSLSVRAFFFFLPSRVEECTTLSKTLCSSLSLSSPLTNQSREGVGL